MNRPLLLTAAAALLVLTACGTVQTGTAAGQAPEAAEASRSAQAEQARKDAAERYRQDLAEHDRRYPQVAQACATVVDATPSAGTPARDPEVAKHAENNFFKQTLPLSATAQCRGDAHAARITTALAGGKDGAQTQQVLESLGYPARAIKVTADDTSPAGFVLEVPGAGPCIEGIAYQSGRLEIEAHGYYQEGGCEMPKGGH